MKPRPTAIFCGNDEMAAGVYKAARDAGLSIPGDISVDRLRRQRDGIATLSAADLGAPADP